MYIVNNDFLTSLSGLESIAPASIIDLNIYNNSLLSNCAVASICEYLVEPNGIIDIHDNTFGCNSQEEVQDDCDSITSVSELLFEETFTISPNPLESTTLIKYTIQNKSPVTIKILDLTGQEIKTLVDDLEQQGEQQYIFNTGDLPSGIYFCVLKTSNGMQTKKIIKL